jgi:hypothetical protein
LEVLAITPAPGVALPDTHALPAGEELFHPLADCCVQLPVSA